MRRRVLGLLFREYERDFYQREIVDAVSCGSGAVQRELKQLADAGLITREERGRMVFYQANRESPVFDELRGLVMKTSGLADVLRDALAPDADRIDVAFIYGSMAEGTDDAQSDVDVMVIGDIGLRPVSKRLWEPQCALNREINPIIWS
ncbi:MAG: ArsR family transcriptional regulator, partial [Armatimonadota bacterium]